jgi:hypothetical protein
MPPQPLDCWSFSLGQQQQPGQRQRQDRASRPRSTALLGVRPQQRQQQQRPNPVLLLYLLESGLLLDLLQPRPLHNRNSTGSSSNSSSRTTVSCKGLMARLLLKGAKAQHILPHDSPHDSPHNLKRGVSSVKVARQLQLLCYRQQQQQEQQQQLHRQMQSLRWTQPHKLTLCPLHAATAPLLLPVCRLLQQMAH